MHSLFKCVLEVSALILVLPATLRAAPLVTPGELAARLAQPELRVLDIRVGKDEAGRTSFENGHIAGSLPAPYPS